jgi:biotin transport system substrate-specific component
MLIATPLQQADKQRLPYQVLLAGLGALLLFLTSQISIPLEPVPVTLQTLSVMLIGLTFDRKAALNAVGLYLLLGAIGLPVFSEFSGGFLHLIGPKGGYLLGFAFAVVAMGAFRTVFKRDTLLNNLVNCLLGTSLIFMFGISWLSRFIGFEMAIKGGLLPFVIPGLVKAGLLCVALGYFKTGHLFRKK